MTARLWKRRLYGRLLIWSAVVVQLHLLFVQDLHHHGAEASAADSQQAQVLSVAGGLQIAAARGQPSPLCAACQITRHGSVKLEPSKLTPFQSVELGAVAPPPALAFHPVPQLTLTGRDPPLFS